MDTAFTTSRRTVLAAAGTASAALALAACGGSGGGGGQGGQSSPDTGDQPTGDGPSEPGGGGDAVLLKTSEVPEGGGRVVEAEKVVVTQPSAGEFKAFSAVCTHQGCLVSSVSDGTINCDCHGSRFAIGDGSVARGPATRPLPELDVSVRGGTVRRG